MVRARSALSPSRDAWADLCPEGARSARAGRREAGLRESGGGMWRLLPGFGACRSGAVFIPLQHHVPALENHLPGLKPGEDAWRSW